VSDVNRSPGARAGATRPPGGTRRRGRCGRRWGGGRIGRSGGPGSPGQGFTGARVGGGGLGSVGTPFNPTCGSGVGVPPPLFCSFFWGSHTTLVQDDVRQRPLRPVPRQPRAGARPPCRNRRGNWRQRLNATNTTNLCELSELTPTQIRTL